MSQPIQMVETWRITSGKTEKEFSSQATAMKIIGKSSASKKFQLFLKDYNFCEYVKFGAISCKIDILPKTASLKFKSENYHCDYLPNSKFCFYKTDF